MGDMACALVYVENQLWREDQLQGSLHGWRVRNRQVPQRVSEASWKKSILESSVKDEIPKNNGSH